MRKIRDVCKWDEPTLIIVNEMTKLFPNFISTVLIQDPSQDCPAPFISLHSYGTFRIWQLWKEG